MSTHLSRSAQVKAKEIDFFDHQAAAEGFDVFTHEGRKSLIQRCIDLADFKTGMQVADLGCGSGVCSQHLGEAGLKVTGLDLSSRLISVARKRCPEAQFVEGDVERLPFATESMDGVLLSSLIHHLPDPSLCAAEVYRVLKPGARFVAFDPNARNPFFWLFRHPDSFFYNPDGVTENERPITHRDVEQAFGKAGFSLRFDYTSVAYRTVESQSLRWAVPLYNFLDKLLFGTSFMTPYRPFMITIGVKLQ